MLLIKHLHVCLRAATVLTQSGTRAVLEGSVSSCPSLWHLLSSFGQIQPSLLKSHGMTLT